MEPRRDFADVCPNNRRGLSENAAMEAGFDAMIGMHGLWRGARRAKDAVLSKLQRPRLSTSAPSCRPEEAEAMARDVNTGVEPCGDFFADVFANTRGLLKNVAKKSVFEATIRMDEPRRRAPRPKAAVLSNLQRPLVGTNAPSCCPEEAGPMARNVNTSMEPCGDLFAYACPTTHRLSKDVALKTGSEPLIGVGVLRAGAHRSKATDLSELPRPLVITGALSCCPEETEAMARSVSTSVESCGDVFAYICSRNSRGLSENVTV